ncbi:MAG: hypothetical protein ACT4P7_12690, partial [Gemmatimonadaceae bacterium]
MAKPVDEPVTDALEDALAASDVDELAKVVTELDEQSRQVLRQEWGDAAFERTTRSARHVRRGGQKGRVVVLNGIMGARLAVAEDGSEAREIWLRL